MLQKLYLYDPTTAELNHTCSLQKARQAATLYLQTGKKKKDRLFYVGLTVRSKTQEY